MVTKTIKIVLVEDHKLTRLGINALISTKPDLQLCGEAATAAEGLSLIDAYQPDIAIIDIGLPDKNGLTLAEEIKHKYRGIKIIILTGETKKELVKLAFSNGADSYCTKLTDDENLLAAIYTTYKEKSWVDSVITQLLIDNFKTNREEFGQFAQPTFYEYMLHPDRLTPKELEVLQFICAGMSNEEIANKLCISPGTVRTHTHKIFQKLGVNNRMQAMLVATERGLVKDEYIVKIKK